MKKLLLLLIISVFLVLFTGCAEETTSISVGTSSPDTPPDNNVVETLQNLSGTYEIIFFGSEIQKYHNGSNEDLLNSYNDYYITNDCKKALELFPDIINKNNKNKCEQSNQINLLTNQAVIFFHNKYKEISLKAKLQTEKGMADKFLTYKYQYITFGWSNKLTGNDIKEYYYDVASKNVSNVAYENGSHSYTITKLDEETIKIDILYNKKDIYLDVDNFIQVSLKNTYILKKNR